MAFSEDKIHDQYTDTPICKSMILPYFDYGDVIYMAGSKTLLAKPQRLQNKALWVCLNIENRQ